MGMDRRRSRQSCRMPTWMPLMRASNGPTTTASEAIHRFKVQAAACRLARQHNAPWSRSDGVVLCSMES